MTIWSNSKTTPAKSMYTESQGNSGWQISEKHEES